VCALAKKLVRNQGRQKNPALIFVRTGYPAVPPQLARNLPGPLRGQLKMRSNMSRCPGRCIGRNPVISTGAAWTRSDDSSGMIFRVSPLPPAHTFSEVAGLDNTRTWFRQRHVAICPTDTLPTCRNRVNVTGIRRAVGVDIRVDDGTLARIHTDSTDSSHESEPRRTR
jgi:hypothetical protein